MAAPTFEAFQASRVETDDLAHASNNIAPEWFEDEHRNVRKAAGFIYGGDCYIERRTDGRFLLVLGTDMTVDADLETLERKLYEWAVDECLFEGEG